MITPDFLINIFVYFVFFSIILLLLYDKWSSENRNVKEKEKLLDELSKAIKAVISKNANDYVMTASIDKIPQEDKPIPAPDEVLEETLNDDQFFKAIEKSNKE